MTWPGPKLRTSFATEVCSVLFLFRALAWLHDE
jgi:hypothetical protein